MDWNQNQIAAIIGAKELEIIGLRMQLGAAQAELHKLREPKAPEASPPLEVVK